jgi:hypothetical protein
MKVKKPKRELRKEGQQLAGCNNKKSDLLVIGQRRREDIRAKK